MATAIYDFLLKAEHEVEQHLLSDEKLVFVDSMPWILCSAIIWGVMFKVVNYEKEDPYTTSNVHAVLLGLVGVFNLCVGHGDYEPLAFCLSAGYFLADFFIFCLKPNNRIFILHHVLTVGASARMINGRNWNDRLFASSCWLVEFSTPFLNLYQMKPSPVYGAIFIMSFFVLRILWLSYLSFHGISIATYGWEMLIIVAFTGLNYYWFFDMLRIAWVKRKEALRNRAEEMMQNLKQNEEIFRQKAEELIQNVKDNEEALRHKAEELIQNFRQKAEEVYQHVKENEEAIRQKSEELIQTVKNNVEVAAQNVRNNVESAAQNVKNNVDMAAHALSEKPQ